MQPSRSWSAPDFYPRPPRGGRPDVQISFDGDSTISIHALREEGDPSLCAAIAHGLISIHALREEGDRPTTP